MRTRPAAFCSWDASITRRNKRYGRPTHSSRRRIATMFRRTCVLARTAALVALVGLSSAQPLKLTDDARTVAKDNNVFALDLYAQLAKEDANLFFSPYSISSALAMTYAGAKGKTAED